MSFLKVIFQANQCNTFKKKNFLFVTIKDLKIPFYSKKKCLKKKKKAYHYVND
jgi:hypothetical protein